jgi:lysozyme family protein
MPDVIDAIDALIVREGGFSDHPADAGGSTRWGITQRRLSEWRGQPASRDDVFDLTKEEAREIYVAWYVTPMARIKHLHRLFELMLDIGVLSGPETAIKMLQHEANEFTTPLLAVDGILGPKTAAAVEALPEAVLRQALVVARIPALVRIVEGDPTQLVFLEGWVTRTLTFLPEAGA